MLSDKESFLNDSLPVLQTEQYPKEQSIQDNSVIKYTEGILMLSS